MINKLLGIACRQTYGNTGQIAEVALSVGKFYRKDGHRIIC